MNDSQRNFWFVLMPLYVGLVLLVAAGLGVMIVVAIWVLQ